MITIISCSHFSNDFHFQVTKLLFDYGANLDFKTFWSVNENGLAVAGRGDNEGNAVQLLRFIKKRQLHDKLQITAKHFDKVLQYFGREVFSLKSLINKKP
jgi:hypothetical protein